MWTALILTLSALSPAALLGRQDAQSVTLEAMAEPVLKVIEQVSAQSGIRLETGRMLQDDFLIIKVNKVPVNALMEKIAQALSAEWTKEGEGFRLVRSNALLAKLRSQDELYRATHAQQCLDAVRRKLDKDGPFDEATAKQLALDTSGIIDSMIRKDDRDLWIKATRLAERGPGHKFPLRAFSCFDARTLASIPLDTRIVFSNAPTSVQRPLPGSVGREVQKWLAEQSLWASAAQAVDWDRIPDQYGNFLRVGTFPRPSGISETPARVLVGIRAYAHGGFVVESKIGNQAGECLSAATANVSTTMDRQDMPDPPKFEELRIELSAPSAAFAAAVRQPLYDLKGASSPVRDTQVLEVLLNPELHDPAQYALSEALIASAIRAERNLVCAVPEGEGSRFARMASDKSMDVGSLGWYYIEGARALRLSDSVGWTIGTYSRPYFELQRRFPRAAVGAFLREVVRTGSLSLDSLASLVATSPATGYQVSWRQLLMLVAPSQLSVTDEFDWEFVRLFGLLTLPQRELLKRGQAIRFEALMTVARAQAERITYGSYGRVNDSSMVNEASATDPNAWDRLRNNLRNEPTERLPAGIPADTMLTLSLSLEKRIRMITSSENSTSIGDLSLASFGSDNVQRGLRYDPGIEGMTTYRYMERENCLFRLVFEPTLSATGTVVLIKRSDKPVADAKDLKEDVRRMIQEEKDKASKGRIPPRLWEPSQKSLRRPNGPEMLKRRA